MSNRVPSLHEQQRALTRHLRDPLRYPSPAGMNAARVKVYRELIPANLMSLLGGTFPVLVSLLGEQAWALLIKRFLRDCPSHTPRFGEISAQFVEFLAGLDPASIPASCWRPFMVELAHYEWVEVDLMQRDETPFARAPEMNSLAFRATGSHATHVTVMERSLHLSPLAWPLAYTWPVHRLGPEYQPAQPPEWPTLLLVRRDPDDVVRFSELSPLAWHLLQSIEQYPGMPVRILLQQLGEEAAAPDMSVFMASAEELLQSLLDQQVVAVGGAYPSPTASRD